MDGKRRWMITCVLPINSRQLVMSAQGTVSRRILRGLCSQWECYDRLLLSVLGKDIYACPLPLGINYLSIPLHSILGTYNGCHCVVIAFIFPQNLSWS